MIDKFTWGIVGAIILFILSLVYHNKNYDVAKATAETNPYSMDRMEIYTSNSGMSTVWRLENKEAVCYIYVGEGISCFKK